MRVRYEASAAVAATEFQHLFAAETHQSCRAVVLPDAEPVWLVGLRQWQCHRRIILVAVVEDLRGIGPIRRVAKGWPVLRFEFLNEWANCQAVDEGHGMGMTKMRTASH
ncbi:MAG: hypothetical protein QOC63_972 [Mycobacterium sp.]|nr:hypothetical protein [Mycobacterium sp.]